MKEVYVMNHAEGLARLVLLFWKPYFTPADRQAWMQITGQSEVTSRALGDYARMVLQEEVDANLAIRSAEQGSAAPLRGQHRCRC